MWMTGCAPPGPNSTAPRTVSLAGARDGFGIAPFSINRHTTREHTALPLSTLDGALPADLAGHVFIQSLALGPDDLAFGGDSMIWRIDLGPNPTVTNRIPRHADRLLYEGAAGTHLAFHPRGISRTGPLGLQSMANTALVPINGNRLIATMDGGRPWEVDPATLASVAPVGSIDDYRQVVQFTGLNELLAPIIISTAHPAYDHRTGEFYGMSTSIVPGANFCDVMVWDGQGPARAVSLYGPDSQPIWIRQSAHQMCVTRHHVIIIDSGITFEGGKLLGNVEAVEAGWMNPPVNYSRLTIVSRAALASGAKHVSAVVAKIPRESGHFHVDYDSSENRCVVHVPHTPASDVGEWLLKSDTHPSTGAPVDPRLVGAITPLSYDQGVVGRYEIDTNTGSVIHGDSISGEWAWGSGGLTARNPLTPDDHLGDMFHANFGFPTNLAIRRADRAFRNYEHRIIDHDTMPWAGVPTTLVRIDHDDLALRDGYTFPGDRFCWNITFAPRHGTSTASTDGYIVAVVYSDQPTPNSSGVEFWIFDAANLSTGPLAKLGHRDLDVPLTLHSTWLSHLTATRPELTVDVVGELTRKAATWRFDPLVADIVKEHVAPAFA